ncbi:MAG: GntR family transcriptional regulator [Burkholderiaceae bacterium]
MSTSKIKKNAAASQPRYLWLRECLLRDITNGKYPVGSLLPGENELTQLYGVSRHTVREASRKLADDGLISRHPGIGTIVCSRKEKPVYVAALGTLPELFDYTNSTRVQVLDGREIIATGELADTLECEESSAWLNLEALRFPTGQDIPISYTRIYLRPEFSDIRERLHGNHASIYSMLEQHHGQTIHTVRQEIAATLLPAQAARMLGVKPRVPALHLKRSYLNKKDHLLAVSSNLYPVGRFELRTSWTRGGKRKNP